MPRWPQAPNTEEKIQLATKAWNLGYYMTIVLEESSTFISCLHKQIPFGSILVEVRKQSPRTPYI